MYFPIICVDNFFSDPDYVFKLAEEAEYNKSIDNRWPGARSNYLHSIHPMLFELTFRKIISLFYSYEETLDTVWNVDMTFQKIIPLENQNSFYPDGWVHSDNNNIFAGLIYLSKDSEINTGTSIYTARSPVATPINHKIKEQLYSGTLTDIDLYNRGVKENNDQFEETITVKNKFNRLIMYDAANFHAAKNIMRLTNPRYTLVFFARKFVANRFPIPQTKCFPI